MEVKEKLRFSSFIVILFVSVITLLFYLSRVLLYSDDGYSSLEGIEIGRSDYHSFGTYLNPIDIGLDNDSIENVTNGTLNLEITVSYKTIFHNVTYHWMEKYTSFGRRVIAVENKHDEIFINEPLYNYEYNFSIRYILNSSDPDICNKNLMGDNNTIYGTFSILNNWTIDIRFNQNYDDVTFIDNEKFRIPLKQVIIIKPMIVVA